MSDFVRLDSVEHCLLARAYDEPIDIAVPLREMTAPYVAVATISIAGDTAYVQGLHGTMTHAMQSEVRRQLRRDYGVTRMLWRRQKGDQDARPHHPGA